ncbi:MAG: hypothetical protein IT374_24160 [Polyangiaceae bacterium]|nr:hypothetical protein [Polyangiaceae bacterium]
MPSERPPPPRASSHDARDADPRDDEPESERDRRREGARRLVQRILGEGVRRAVERGVEQITEGPENIMAFVNELKLPREVAGVVFQQIDETKNGLYRATAREIRDFLEHTNLSEELVKALTTLSFEIKTEIRFIPNDQKIDGDPKAVKPDVKSSVRIRDEKKDPEE